MSDPTNRPHDDADTVPIDPDLNDDTETTTTTSHSEHKKTSTNRVENDDDAGTYTDVDRPDDEPTAGAGTA
ncbi:hypothetical protein B0I08_102347 [Glaciihabitans tibetensis]|uniref:Uncharacterized protein n=1 Tax=Glaciihabitans tibetensis TaxID=1266600 RepID=A0A2T0VHJ5_9MICO|nr:hypothetical protein [Glaciihabitans tibetensis]PRY69670.1 hypothetical protein B0I08_102347 [Glaciihabitans tibetensis]